MCWRVMIRLDLDMWTQRVSNTALWTWTLLVYWSVQVVSGWTSFTGHSLFSDAHANCILMFWTVIYIDYYYYNLLLLWHLLHNLLLFYNINLICMYIPVRTNIKFDVSLVSCCYYELLTWILRVKVILYVTLEYVKLVFELVLELFNL